ncbi:MAG TPA: PAS domain S-box protein, partial [Candidatus Angelobacter sp.]
MKSIFTKLTVLNIAAGVLGMAILYLVMDRQLSAGMTENYITHGEVVAQSLAKAVEPAVVNRDLTSVQSALDTVLASPGVRWAYVTSPDGRVLAHTFVPEFPASLSAAGISNARAQVVIMVSPATGGATVFTYPVLTGIVGAVHVGFDREKLIASIHRMEWLVVGSIFAVMLVVTVALALFTRRMVAPIRALTQAAARLGRDQRAVFQVLPVRSNDEVGVLTQAFNSMATEIRGYQESLEERVHQRTQELRQANQNLEVEVTERKRAEGALLRANQTLSTLIQASPAAIITVDQDAIVRLWNPAAEKLFGWAEEEVVGHPLPTVPAGWEKEFEERVRRAFSGETALPTEVSRVRKDGSLVEISAATAAVRDADGAIVGVMAVMQDVTQRKRAEEALQKASAAAEAASRAKSEFLANMSHEIRTPMNGVIGMTELALDTDLTSEQREYLEMVKSSADSLLTVINDILDFSKIEAGKLELDPIEFDIRSSIEETARMLALKAH